MNVTVLHTPGHTPACVSYLIEDSLFVGDVLFMPDNTNVFMCHDYKAKDRVEYQYQSTIREEKNANIHVKKGTTKAEFVEMRTARDATLSMPKLLLPSIQVNMRAGKLPISEDNNIHYLKIPLNQF